MIWGLCSIPDPPAALCEMRRVLRPGWPDPVRGARSRARPAHRASAAAHTRALRRFPTCNPEFRHQPKLPIGRKGARGMCPNTLRRFCATGRAVWMSRRRASRSRPPCPASRPCSIPCPSKPTQVNRTQTGSERAPRIALLLPAPYRRRSRNSTPNTGCGKWVESTRARSRCGAEIRGTPNPRERTTAMPCAACLMARLFPLGSRSRVHTTGISAG